MEWNMKWNTENFIRLGPEAFECPKQLQSRDWSIVNGGGSFDHSGTGGNSGSSGSNCGHSSSTNSSKSASTDYSTMDGMQSPNHRLITFQGSSGNLHEKTQNLGTGISGTYSLVGPSKQLMDLKLGKRTYIENGHTLSQKRTKSSDQNASIPHCQVEGCNIDLSAAKDYHRKHRVCESHAKCPKVIIGGLEYRFCQQCSRFHSLPEFDGKKRSCRNRLSDHNARRRKPRDDAIQFNSTRLWAPLCARMQQISFLLNNTSRVHSRTPASSSPEREYNTKFTLTKPGYPLSYNGDRGNDEKMHSPGIELPPLVDTYELLGDLSNGLTTSKISTTKVFIPGSSGFQVPSQFKARPTASDPPPTYDRALSLLSTYECNPVYNAVHKNEIVTRSPVHLLPGVPLSATEFW